MWKPKKHLARVEQLFRAIFAGLDGEVVRCEPSDHDSRYRVVVAVKSSDRSYSFDVRVRQRITPQIADALFKRLQSESVSERAVSVVYAPVISSRVAEIADNHGISYIDAAGNCRIIDRATGLLIVRTGIHNDALREESKTADLFAVKSSRVVRAMLHEPRRGWKLYDLAKHPDVQVSVGLASKLKHALIEENYVLVRDRLLYLKQPRDLLAAWTRSYRGPSDQCTLYMRGETTEIERRVAQWCEETTHGYALAKFSAARTLAPKYAMLSRRSMWKICCSIQVL